MKNKIAAFLIPVMAIGGSLFVDHNQVDAAANSKGVIVKSVNFRDKPSLTGDQIRYLKSGEEVEILNDVNSYWLKIKDRSGTIGYVSSQSKYVQINDSAESSTTNERFGIVVQSVNFRDKPSVSGERIRYLQSGERVKLIDQVNSYWYKIEDKNGKVGYVSSQSKYKS